MSLSKQRGIWILWQFSNQRNDPSHFTITDLEFAVIKYTIAPIPRNKSVILYKLFVKTIQ